MQRPHATPSTATLLATSLLVLSQLGGCGFAGGGGGAGFGPSFSGGAAGANCDPAQQSHGCVLISGGGTARVRCDEASKTWVEVEVCAAGSACVESADPSDATKKVTECKVAPQGGLDSAGAADGGDGGGVADAGSGDGGGVADAGGSDGGAIDDGGAVVDVGGADAGSSDVVFDSGGGEVVDAGPVDAVQDTSADSKPQDTTPADVSIVNRCWSDSDQSFLYALFTSANVASLTTNAVKDCTLTKGCLAKSGDAAQVACITDCVHAAGFIQEYGVSYDCTSCLAEFKGHCGAKKCIAHCAVDAGSKACADCLATYCDPPFYACIGSPGGIDAGGADVKPSDAWDGGSGDIGAVDGQGGGQGCNTSSKPGCSGCSCEKCVCALDSYCCTTAWDSACVQQCTVDCGATCSGSTDAGTTDVGFDAKPDGGFDAGSDAVDGGGSADTSAGPGCKGNCGNPSQEADGKACYCDEACAQYNDCCSDKKTYCP